MGSVSGGGRREKKNIPEDVRNAVLCLAEMDGWEVGEGVFKVGLGGNTAIYVKCKEESDLESWQSRQATTWIPGNNLLTVDIFICYFLMEYCGSCCHVPDLYLGSQIVLARNSSVEVMKADTRLHIHRNYQSYTNNTLLIPTVVA